MFSTTPGKHWVHLTIGTYASWLPGDPRGWRSRNHKTHSSGDYHQPPPNGEHEELHHYSKRISSGAIAIPKVTRGGIGEKLVEQFRKLGHDLRVLSVGGMHVHGLIELPLSEKVAKHEVGRCKQAAALLVSGQFKPRLWARDCGMKLIRDADHFGRVVKYIKDHEQEGAWVWLSVEGRNDVVPDPAAASQPRALENK